MGTNNKTSPVIELWTKLATAVDKEGHILNMGVLLEVLSALEVTPVTVNDLMTTRLGKMINDIRRNTSDKPLAKRLRNLVKTWNAALQVSQSVQSSAPGESRALPLPPPSLLSLATPSAPPLGGKPSPGLLEGGAPGRPTTKASSPVPSRALITAAASAQQPERGREVAPLASSSSSSSSTCFPSPTKERGVRNGLDRSPLPHQPGLLPPTRVHSAPSSQLPPSSLSLPTEIRPSPPTRRSATPPSSVPLSLALSLIGPLVVSIPLACEASGGRGVVWPLPTGRPEPAHRPASLLVRISRRRISTRTAAAEPYHSNSQSQDTGFGSGSSSLNLSDFSPITPVSCSVDRCLSNIGCDPATTHSALRPPRKRPLSPPTPPTGSRRRQQLNGGRGSPGGDDHGDTESSRISQNGKILRSSSPSPARSPVTFLSGITHLDTPAPDINFTEDGIQPGYHGYFTIGGTWCDWTMTMPTHKECVDVFPYIYMD